MLVSAGGADRSGARADEQTDLGQDTSTHGAHGKPCFTQHFQLCGLVSSLDEAG